jgi:putative ABC transport system substrate-binding protein
VKCRAFIGLLVGAAAWPLAARAQKPAMPVIGFLDQGQPELLPLGKAFRQGC